MDEIGSSSGPVVLQTGVSEDKTRGSAILKKRKPKTMAREV
jgi:hypothetical protein